MRLHWLSNIHEKKWLLFSHILPNWKIDADRCSQRNRICVRQDSVQPSCPSSFLELTSCWGRSRNERACRPSMFQIITKQQAESSLEKWTILAVEIYNAKNEIWELQCYSFRAGVGKLRHARKNRSSSRRYSGFRKNSPLSVFNFSHTLASQRKYFIRIVFIKDRLLRFL